VNPNAGYILMVTIIGQYLIYETFHYCCHVRDNWFVRTRRSSTPFRRHHTAHHNYGIMMSRNMNLTFPIADWVMGTSDLDRGLVGTLFNGYNEEHRAPGAQADHRALPPSGRAGNDRRPDPCLSSCRQAAVEQYKREGSIPRSA
jgi:hypothetical protein